MMRSLNSAVAGLRAHQTKMDVIGNNIANVNTYGFKASRAVFADVYYQTLNSGTGAVADQGGNNPTQIGYGSKIATIDRLDTMSGPAATDRPFDIYIEGDGLITVKKGSETFYTRLGRLGFDAAGNLVDGNGNKVQGIEQKVTINNNGTPTLPPVTQPTKPVKPNPDDYVTGTYPNGADNPAYDTAVANYETTLLPAYNTALAAYNAYVASYSDDYPTYDPLFTPPNGTWGDSELVNISLGKDLPVLSVLTNLTIDKQGRIIGTLTEDYTSLELYNGQAFKANDQFCIGQLALARFSNTEGLVQVGNSYLQKGNNTGNADYVIAGTKSTGNTQAGMLEASNVDISKEFTDMITTQRGFQANTRIITVSDEMLQELVNLKR